MEEWRDILGAEGFYAFDGKNTVKRLGRTTYDKRGHLLHWPERVLKWKKNKSGRLFVHLMNRTSGLDINAKYRYHLVWEYYNGAIPEGYEIHHINGDSLDDRIENLQLVTPNSHDEIHKERGDIGIITKEKYSKKVVQYSMEGDFIQVWESRMECHRHGFALRAISSCCKGNWIYDGGHHYKNYLWYDYDDVLIDGKPKAHVEYIKPYKERDLSNSPQCHKNNYRSKSVKCFKDGKLIAQFPSRSEAARQLGLSAGNIAACCKGKIKQTGGYQFA